MNTQNDHSFVKIAIGIAIGISFGFWQNNVSAGIFMGLLILSALASIQEFLQKGK